MALSEQEQRMLEEIERALIAEDPKLARRASEGEEKTFSFNLQSLALILLGICALVGGMTLAQQSLWFVGVSILGFLVMFAGGLLAFRKTGTGSAGARNSVKRAGEGRSLASSKKGKGSGNFGDRIEENFRRRFEQ